MLKGGAALDQRNAAARPLARPDLTIRGFSKVPQGFPVQGHRLFGYPHRLVAASLRGRSSRQSGQNRSSYSPKPITEGTQTLHKGRSEIVPDKLKHSTRGANQIQSRRSDRQSPRNRPSESPKHPTRGTQTLHKGRSETAQGELKPLTRGANPSHGTGFVPLVAFSRALWPIRGDFWYTTVVVRGGASQSRMARHNAAKQSS